VQTFNTQRRDQLVRSKRTQSRSRVLGGSEKAWVHVCEAVVEIDLLKCRLDVGSIGSIREVGTIGRAGHKGTPECTSESALIHTRDVDLTLHATVLHLVGKLGIIYVVAVQDPHQYQQIIVTILDKSVNEVEACDMGGQKAIAREERRSYIPINGFLTKTLSAGEYTT
jgi:hypothetical protein